MRRSTLLSLVCCCLFATAGIGNMLSGAEPDRAAREAENELRLPDGTIRKGTLANAQLIHDAHDGVFVQAVLMGMTKPATEEMFVVQYPVGRATAQCWRERWFLTDENGAMGRFDMLFLEDGQGGATWIVEDSAKVPGGVVARTGDGERAAAMPELNQDALEAVVRKDAERYIAAAKAFVNRANKGNVLGMMAITSPLTIAKYGLEQLHDSYTENYLPHFKDATVAWDDDFVLISDETGNRGIEISGTLKGEKTYRIQLGVMREGGKHVVISFLAKRPSEAAATSDPDRS